MRVLGSLECVDAMVELASMVAARMFVYEEVMSGRVPRALKTMKLEVEGEKALVPEL